MLWAYGIGQFINGNLADKYGARRMRVIGRLLSVAMNWATSFATTYWMFILKSKNKLDIPKRFSKFLYKYIYK